MKVKVLSFLFVLISIFFHFKSTSQAINIQDSLALVDLYDSTNGDSWKDNSNWKTSSPVKSWNGIMVTGNRVTGIKMYGNNLTGSIPLSIGNLSSLTELSFIDNKIGGTLPASIGNLTSLIYLDIGASYIKGNIPAEIGNLINLRSLNLSISQFTGICPASIAGLINLQYLDLGYDNFTFSDIELLVQTINIKNFSAFFYSPQNKIPIFKKGKKILVSPGGTLSKDTVSWYKTGAGQVAVNIGDTSFSPVTAGTYHAEVTNAVATALRLVSDDINIPALLPDSTTTLTKNIKGTSATDIDSGIVKLVTLTPTVGSNALSGNVTGMVTVDAVVAEYNNVPYVQRHYDIIPEQNASTSMATVTLYFTQQDFDNYNDYITTHNLNIPLLPVNGLDNGNVRIIQYHGTFTGSSDPANYSNNTVVITPIVFWNAGNFWWEVTFPVTGFSGFFVSSGYQVLPLTLLDFNAYANNELINLLWTVSAEINTKQFIIQHTDKVAFNDIGKLEFLSAPGINKYQFTDINPVIGNNFYRLKIVDNDGSFKYSKTIKIKFNGVKGGLKIYPNPVTSSIKINFNSEKKGVQILSIADFSGKIVYQINITAKTGNNQTSLNIEKLPTGLYYLITKLNGKEEKLPFVKRR